MELVVDASVAVKWFVEEEDSERASLLLTGSDQLHCPRLLASEMASALWRKVLRGELELGLARARLASLVQTPVSWHSDESLASDAMRLAFAYDRTVYDCLYLALAYRLEARLVTADLRFAHALAAMETGGTVVTLRDYAEGLPGSGRG